MIYFFDKWLWIEAKIFRNVLVALYEGCISLHTFQQRHGQENGGQIEELTVTSVGMYVTKHKLKIQLSLKAGKFE